MTDKTTTTEETKTDFLAVIPEHKPALALTSKDAQTALLTHIDQEIEAFVPDLSTATGREKIKSLAFKIVKTRTALTATAKELTEDWRKQTDAVNAERKRIEEALKLREEKVRAPLTEWEEAEEKRLDACTTTIQRLTALGVVPIDATSASVEATLQEVKGTEIDPGYFQGLTEAALKAQAHTTELLESALARIKQAEEDAAELARLKQAEADRLAEEEEARLAREAEEAEQREAEEAEQREADEQRRLKEEQANAAEKAAADAKRKAEDEARQAQADRDKAHEAELQKERDRIATLEREKDEQAQREAEETERRAKLTADADRRTLAKTEAKEAIIKAVGISEAKARELVLAIIAGDIPRVSLDFAADAPAPAQPELV